ncbi:hypothetical protein ECG_09402 [Echinococcus granulosus]|nr:hypothetical protein ECG_09402 [Echinococcus granulosus]
MSHGRDTRTLKALIEKDRPLLGRVTISRMHRDRKAFSLTLYLTAQVPLASKSIPPSRWHGEPDPLRGNSVYRSSIVVCLIVPLEVTPLHNNLWLVAYSIRIPPEDVMGCGRNSSTLPPSPQGRCPAAMETQVPAS